MSVASSHRPTTPTNVLLGAARASHGVPVSMASVWSSEILPAPANRITENPAISARSGSAPPRRLVRERIGRTECRGKVVRRRPHGKVAFTTAHHASGDGGVRAAVGFLASDCALEIPPSPGLGVCDLGRSECRRQSREEVAGRESRDGNRRNHLGILPQAFVLQKKYEMLEGVVGRVEYAGPVEQFLPLLHLGQLTHAGKRAVNVLGRYRSRKS